ncbi:hypothetical protein TNCV_1775731 [Trichonephila clavipes]|nr:hypothetical protein TNCV_1775731 [Trichonephila clavipes]
MNEHRTNKKVFNTQAMGTRRNGRPNLRWIDVLEKDLLVLRTRNWKTLDCHGWLGCSPSQPGRPIFDDFFQHLWPYIGNNTANVIFQMVKRLWLIRIDH